MRPAYLLPALIGLVGFAVILAVGVRLLTASTELEPGPDVQGQGLRCDLALIVARGDPAPADLLGAHIAICRDDERGTLGVRVDAGDDGGPSERDRVFTLTRHEGALHAWSGAPAFDATGGRVWPPGDLLGVVRGAVVWGPGELRRQVNEGGWRVVGP